MVDGECTSVNIFMRGPITKHLYIIYKHIPLHIDIYVCMYFTLPRNVTNGLLYMFSYIGIYVCMYILCTPNSHVNKSVHKLMMLQFGFN